MILGSKSLVDSLGRWGKAGSSIEEFSALSQGLFFRAVGEKAEVTDAHEAIGQNVEEEAADEFLGMKGHGLFSIAISSISITQGDLAVLDVEDAVIGKSHAVGVAAEVIKHGLWRTERLFRVNHPVLFP